MAGGTGGPRYEEVTLLSWTPSSWGVKPSKRLIMIWIRVSQQQQAHNRQSIAAIFVSTSAVRVILKYQKSF